MSLRDEINDILAQCEPGPSADADISLEAATRHIREHLADRRGPDWAYCTVTAHNLSDERRIYVAALACKGCQRIHICIVQMREDGLMYVCPPVESE